MEIKALPLLTRTFLETAVIDTFQRNTYHEALFQWHVKQIRTIPNPGQPPYYQDSFFTNIKDVVDEGLLNIKTMSSGTWYKVLLENLVTHTVDANGDRMPKPCKVEINHPEKDWEKIWQVISTPGLPSDLSSFTWRMIHNILPTRSRLFRMKMPNIENPNCELCTGLESDTVLHSLLLCSHVNSAREFLMTSLRNTLPDLTPERVILLDFEVDDCLPLVFLTSSILSQVWIYRKEKKEVDLNSIRASLEASIQILRKSRFKPSAEKIQEMISVNSSL